MPSSGCTDKPEKPLTKLERIKQTGEIKIATDYDADLCCRGPGDYAGLEHDLGQLFAQRLGVRARFIASDTGPRIPSMLANHRADLAVAGWLVDATGNPIPDSGAAYRAIAEPALHHRPERPAFRDIEERWRSLAEAAAGGNLLDMLSRLRRPHRPLRWSSPDGPHSENTVSPIDPGVQNAALAQSDLTLHLHDFYPSRGARVDKGRPRDISWVFGKDTDSSLYDEAVRFFDEIRQSRQLDQLVERYYGHMAAYDDALDRSLRADYGKRLPKYRAMFQRAARESGLDWRLLAALAYQESHWDGRAVSAEGVRGLMMLTRDTARELGVDRLNPAQAIRGGASYLKEALDAIAGEVDGPDRTWMALAAYNVGYGHVEDARRLARERGGDPDKWIDVKTALPLLNKRSWYRRTRHGRARGTVAVHYVNSIRRFYELLVWLTEEDARSVAEAPRRVRAGGA